MANTTDPYAFLNRVSPHVVMSTTTTRHTTARKLTDWQRSGGNWRLKALLYAYSDHGDPHTVGRVWPRSRPRTSRDYVNLALRHPDTHEHTVARTLHDADAVRHGEVVPRDQYISRALTSDAATELDVLWREELLATIQAGADAHRIARDTTTVTTVGAKKGDLTAHGQTSFAQPSDESASAGFNEESYLPIPYDCTKFEQGFAITEELIDQAEVDQIERQIQAAGTAVENAINRHYVTNCIDNAGNDHSSVGNEISVQDILEAAEFPADSDFDPADVAVIHPEALTELADDPSLNYLVFSRTHVADDRALQADGNDQAPNPDRAFGPQIWIASDATYNGLAGESLDTSNTYGWEAGSEIGGFVHGSVFVHTVLYGDISVSELVSPVTDIRDVQGGVASVWADSVQPSNNAIATFSQ